MVKYSDAEIEMFNEFGFGDFIKNNVEPTTLYSVCAEHIFIENLTGPRVEGFRRAYKAFAKASPFRLTKEFDELITNGT